MARLVKRLKPLTVSKKRKPGYYPDGAGLYLQISRSGSKSWIFRFMLDGRAREMGLGSFNAVSLDEARDKAQGCRNLLVKKIDPIEQRAADETANRVAAANQITFDECATAYIGAHKPGWKNAKHAAQWAATLKTYASPVIGPLPVQAIDTGLVMKVLEPIWREKTETASRVRGRVESILDWATVREHRQGENPARWRGHLDKLLPKRSKVSAVRHHPALPYPEVAAFMKKLRCLSGVAPRALEFIILTAARESEVVNTTWDEIDLNAQLWTVPPERMKSRREHRVPLSDAALAVLDTLKTEKQNKYVFTGWRVGRPLTGASCLKVLRDMGYKDITVHGFRSTFRDWAAEQTNYPREVAEAALAHVIDDKVEAAYRRGDMLRRRALLMDAWTKYCSKLSSSTVTPIRKKHAR